MRLLEMPTPESIARSQQQQRIERFRVLLHVRNHDPNDMTRVLARFCADDPGFVQWLLEVQDAERYGGES